MELIRLTDGADPRYARARALYQESFPYHEQREEASQRKILDAPEYQYNLIYDGDLWAGLLLCWETETFIYVEHFCTFPELRGRSYGQRALAELAHRVGAVMVVDGAQSTPHMPVDVKALDVDFAACSAHKLYAPMGMGALYARRELLDKMPPFLSGGDMIGAVHEHSATWAEGPRKFEAGTRNVGGEVGFAAALDYIDHIGWQTMMDHEHALLERMLKGMADMPWLTVYGDPTAAKRFGVVSFNVQDVHPHDVATILDAGGVAIRAGHHCAQPLMDFLGIGSCCRASVAIYNTPEDIDALLNNLENVRKVMGL